MALVVVLAAGSFFIYNQWRVVDVEINPQNIVSEEIPQLPEHSQIKAVYINEFIASSATPFAEASRRNLKRILAETELNGVVIDIKENNGVNLPVSLGYFIQELHRQGVWAIARICVFRDSSLIETNPEWYLKDPAATSSDGIWRNAGGVSWLDPNNHEVQAYIIDFSKKALDFGFDELQFDYIRYPEEYKIISGQEKIRIIGDFFSKLPQDLREYKPSIILSVDLFGYLATQFQSLEIGQRLSDASKYFDYISFMLYPSHFYGGFSVGYDSKRGLPALDFAFPSDNPYPIILRSLLSSIDYLSILDSKAQIRPWLQDFNLTSDVSRGVIYDTDKVKAQIQGAQDGGASGWLLWNSGNIYTEDALRKNSK